MVIGALGAVIHGSPLRTGDIDICPDRDARNLERLARSLRDLHAEEWEPNKGDTVQRDWTADVLVDDKIWILATQYGDLDLVFEPAGTGGYADLRRDAVSTTIGDVTFEVASLADIIRSKEATGRPKDLEQLPTLRRLQERLLAEG